MFEILDKIGGDWQEQTIMQRRLRRGGKDSSSLDGKFVELCCFAGMKIGCILVCIQETEAND